MEMVVLHEFATFMLDSNNMSWMVKKKVLDEFTSQHQEAESKAVHYAEVAKSSEPKSINADNLLSIYLPILRMRQRYKHLSYMLELFILRQAILQAHQSYAFLSAQKSFEHIPQHNLY